jgi:hypothetical protein
MAAHPNSKASITRGKIIIDGAKRESGSLQHKRKTHKIQPASELQRVSIYDDHLECDSNAELDGGNIGQEWG